MNARLAVAVLLVAAAAAVTAGLRADAGDTAVVVADERGRELASVPLPEEGRFAIQYRHSVYRAEVTETFAVADGGFQLVAITSPSEAVLDSYELEGRRGGRPRLAPGAGRHPAPGVAAPCRHRGRPPHPGRRRPPGAAVHPRPGPGPPGPGRPPLTDPG